jgi:hypothetical protein
MDLNLSGTLIIGLQWDGENGAAGRVDQASGHTPGINDPGRTTTMVADHQGIAASVFHRGQHLFYHRSTPDVQRRVGAMGA